MLKYFSLFILGFIFFACKNTKQENTKQDNVKHTNEVKEIDDPHSFSKPKISSVKHLHLVADIDFINKKINGIAKYFLNPNFGNELILDTKELEIHEVNLVKGSEKKKVTFSFGIHDSILGKGLLIPLDPLFQEVEISYSTTKDAMALMWIEKEQTDSKKFPYLFTQSQSIYARSWIPCPDGPGMRFTYSAEITVPKGMMAAMSAENTQKVNQEGKYKFQMNFPIPAYLLALAVGEFDFLPIGSQTGVYASPSIVSKAQEEFVDLQKMLEAAENLYGKYPWGRYDVLVLPSSFPFGGMENPMLTFATPSILAGDRSLTSLLAHELAHSWSGNLITNSTWNDFWINEGFTTYFESRIMESLYGKEYADMLSTLGYQDLQKTIQNLENNSPLSKLHLELNSQDPELSLSDIAYEKGKLFLRMLEEKYGREKFDRFLKAYFNEFQFQSMDSYKFENFLNEKLLHSDPKMQSVVKEWIYEPGLPLFKPSYSNSKFLKVEEEVKVFLNSKSVQNILGAKYSTHEWLHLIRQLPVDSTNFIVKSIDSKFALRNSGNSEILCAWLEYVIKNGQTKTYAKEIEKFLRTIGRRKFLMPIYTSLQDTGNKTLAMELFEKSKSNYHPLTLESISDLFSK